VSARVSESISTALYFGKPTVTCRPEFQAKKDETAPDVYDLAAEAF
jgi:hypothetical protein